MIGSDRMIDATGEETATTIGRHPAARTDVRMTETETEVDIESGRETMTGTRAEAGVEGVRHRNTETTSAPHPLVQRRQVCIPVASRERKRTSGVVHMGVAATASI